LSESSDPQALQAASLALLALRASLPPGDRPAAAGVRLGAGGAPLTAREAAAALAALAKPVACRAGVRGDVLAVSTEPIPDGAGYRARGVGGRMIAGLRPLAAAADTADALVEFVASEAGDALVLPWAAVERWAAEYSCEELSFGWDDPDEGTRRRGLAASVQVGYGRITPVYFP